MVDRVDERLDYRRGPQKQASGMDDASALLGPGIYVLRQEGWVVHVGWAKCMLTMIAAHREFAGTPQAHWFPIKGIRFDSVEYRPCPAHLSDQTLHKVKGELSLDRAA